MANKKPLLLAGLFMGAAWYFWGIPLMFKDTLVGNQAAIEANLARDLKRTFGFTDAQAAGIIGNLAHESAGFSTLQEINPTQTSRKGRELGGYGYAQWTGKRRRAFLAWAAANGHKINGYEANWGFLRHELETNHSYVIRSVKRTRTVAGAVLAFENTFLLAGIKHWGSRKQRAEHTYNRITAGGGRP